MISKSLNTLSNPLYYMYYIILYYIILDYMILYYIISYYIILYHIILYYTSPLNPLSDPLFLCVSGHPHAAAPTWPTQGGSDFHGQRGQRAQWRLELCEPREAAAEAGGHQGRPKAPEAPRFCIFYRPKGVQDLLDVSKRF